MCAAEVQDPTQCLHIPMLFKVHQEEGAKEREMLLKTTSLAQPQHFHIVFSSRELSEHEDFTVFNTESLRKQY